MNILWMLLAGALLLGTQAAVPPPFKPAGVPEWFNPQWDKLTGDPAHWTGEVKSRVVMVAASTAIVSALGASMGLAGATAVLLFGIPKLNWTIVLAVGFLFYAYKKKQKLLLIGGAWVGYCYFKGYSPML